MIEDADESVPDLSNEFSLFVALDCDILDEMCEVIHKKGLLIG